MHSVVTQQQQQQLRDAVNDVTQQQQQLRNLVDTMAQKHQQLHDVVADVVKQQGGKKNKSRKWKYGGGRKHRRTCKTMW